MISPTNIPQKIIPSLCAFLLLLLFVGRVMADPASPVPDFELGKIIAHIPGEAETLAVQGDYAYVGFENDLVIIGIADKTAPVEVGRLGIEEKIYHLAVAGQYAYLATTSGLQVVEISQPANPIWRSIYEEYLVTEVQIRENLVYILSRQGLKILSLNQSPNLVLMGKFDIVSHTTNPYEPYDLDILDGYAFALGRGAVGDLLIIEVANPTQPFLEAFIEHFGVRKIHVSRKDIISVFASCSSTCVTLFWVQNWEWGVWDRNTRYFSQIVSSSYSNAVTADNIYAYVGRDIGLFVYNYQREKIYPPVSIFETGNIRDIVVQGDYIYAVGIESDDYFNPPRLGGFYVLSAPPLFNSYLPIMVR